VVQEASEQASSADSRRMARRCLHLFQFPRKGPRTCSRNRIRRRQSAIPQGHSGSAEELRAAVARTAEAFGTLDIFVSNAGILTRGTIDTYTLEDFDRMVAINVRAAFVGIQAAAQEMNDGGRIVIIGSCTAIRTAVPGASVYSMTKAALVGLVRGAAIDLAPRAITVNNVQPGPTATDMSSAHAELAKTLIPLKRMGDVSEVASFVSYLASEEAGFITGASLTIDGGYVA